VLPIFFGTIITGTIFGETKLPLRKWFIAIYLLSTTSKGISSVQLSKHVGVTQKTAWFMDHRIRKAMRQNGGQLFGPWCHSDRHGEEQESREQGAESTQGESEKGKAQAGNGRVNFPVSLSQAENRQ
jgi:hypothetical protein